MPYMLTRFATVAFPIYELTHPIGTVPAAGGAVPVIGGAYDTHGAGRAPAVLPYDLHVSCVAGEATLSTLLATLKTVRALNRYRYQLWRSDADGNEQWAWARLKLIPAERRPGLGNRQPLDMLFEVWSPWRGAHHATTYYLSDGYSTTLTYTNAGEADVSSAVITITAGGTDLTNLLLTWWPPGATVVYEWQFTGTVGAGSALVIDCGAQSVYNNGVEDYAHFDLTANHDAGAWLALPSGESTLEITKTGGVPNTTLICDFYDEYD